ncbi:serine-rich adhesin for platelets isoform X2 [Cardiocondyla obscurior]|uniref:serine-rich adhesin for platelets isoform X2 n=1 Tax=Cardiocondyla obscurior TaxID=286306 RepID=UPI0039656308
MIRFARSFRRSNCELRVSANAAPRDIKNAMFNNDGGFKLNSDDTKSTIIELFPWVSEFKKMCKCIYADKSMASLAELMQYYIRNVSISVNECYTKPLRAAKLKDSISETLLLFLYIYRELSEDRNRSIYLNNMSDLLALYIDMELKASKKSKEDHNRICTRLTSCLYVYLEHSTEHLLDTLIKIQFMCRGYHRILDPIITKVIKNIPAHPESNIMYIRYLLIYCLWRKINSDIAVKSQIITTAIASLGAPPAAFPPCVLEDVLPKVPKCQPNSAKYLMQQKFDIRKCCELFIQFCRESRGGTWQQKSENVSNIPSSSKRITSQLLEVTSHEKKNMDHTENNFISSDKDIKNNSVLSNNLKSSDKDVKNNSMLSNNLKSLNLTEQTNVKPLGTISTNISVTRTICKSIKPKVLPRKRTKKSNKIVIIDLTTDIASERCIKKRKSRKVAWLEEAKKKFDTKTIRASQKIKNQQMTENVNFLKKITLNQQSEDSSQPVHVTENATLKNDFNTSATQDAKLGNEKIKSMQHLDTKHKNTSVINGNTVSAKQSVDLNSSSSSKTVETLHCAVSSVIVDTPQSNKSKATLSEISNNATKINKCHVNLEVRNNKRTNDRHSTQTVIKRLIEKDTPPESETRKRVESLRKICDLGTEHSKTVNTLPSICAQDDSKDKDDNSNHKANYLRTTKDKLSPHIISSLQHTHCRNNVKDRTNNGKIDDYGNHKKCMQRDTRETISNETSCLKSTAIDSELNKEKFAVSTTATETRTTTTVRNVEVLINDASESERLQQSCITENTNTKHLQESESQDKYITNHDIKNSTISISIMNGDHSNVQTDLKVGTCTEVNDDVRNNRFSNNKIRETIFGNHTSDKKNISDVLDMSLCSKEVRINGEKNIDLKTDRKESSESNRTCDRENNIKEFGRSSVLCEKIDQMHDRKSPKESYEISHTKNTQDVLKDKCMIQDSELHDNIDGLSLLANVIASQHVSHLKTERELKYEQIKVKDYASLRSSPYNQTTDDEVDTNDDSSNTVSQVLENSAAEVTNRIVGIYPEDALDKVALHVEVTSTTDPDDSENDPSNSVSHIVETINYETDTISNNLSMMENNVQSIKENTNVILNGETVVLLQKSPNSNLYIINKAVENRDHNSDDESCLIKEKSWMIPPEDCASFEVVNTSEHISFNLDLPQYNKELSCQENKYSVGRNKGIKIEPEEESSLMSITEMKSYGKKGSLTTDVLPATSQIYQDTNIANVSISKSVDKRKSKSILTYRQNIKQEFSNHIAPNCGIQGCNGIHSHPHEVIDPQHSLHIPVTHPATIPSIYGNCAAGTDLCMPYHKHCTSVSCSLQINSTTSLHSHTKSANSCGRSHCSCLNCTYDIVAHCRQCIHPATDSHVSCIESNSYFLPTHSSVQTSAVQEHDRTKSEAVISKLYDDQILRKRVLQNNTLEKLDVSREPEKLFKKDMANKLPLKKRLKAQALMTMAYEKVPIKTEKLDNYPGIPMMSIAALEKTDGTEKHPTQIIKSSYELSPSEEDNPHGSYHFNSNIVRMDYYKDMHISNTHHNLTKESTRNHERQFRPGNDQPNAVCLESYQDRTSAQHRDVTNPTSLKRITTETIEQDSACKKAKKTQSSIRQTRSSKRNVPKVNYCYTDVDPEWNPSGESKRRRKKTSR